MKLHIADGLRYKISPAVFLRKDEDDGIESIAIQDFGSIFQIVNDHSLYRDRYSKQVFEYWFKPLNRFDYSMGQSWWMRQGVRYLPWWLLWQLSSALESILLFGLRLTYRMGFWDCPLNMRLRLCDWRWRFWRKRGH